MRSLLQANENKSIETKNYWEEEILVFEKRYCSCDKNFS